MDEPNSPALPLERYRSYLLLLARMQLDPRWQARVDASDIVQQTLLEAHAQQLQDGGAAEPKADLTAWLRRALSNNLIDAMRALRRGKRDVAREQALHAAVEQSSARLENCLAADQSSPSRVAVRNEDLLRMANALEQLPEAQREAIVLHHLQSCSLREVALQLNRTEPAVAGLLHRGLKKLKELMRELE